MKKEHIIALGIGTGAVAATALMKKKRQEALRGLLDENQKFHEFYDVLVQWLTLHHEGITLQEYFHRKGYRTVAIYGMKELGVLLFDELRDTDITVEYVIDRNAEGIYTEVKCFTPTDTFPPVDVCIVTAIHYFDSIEKELKEAMNNPVVSIEDILFDL